jgi:thiol-disulfide isomerase/thioredoxin
MMKIVLTGLAFALSLSALTACGPQTGTPPASTGALAKLKTEQPPKAVSPVSFVDAVGTNHTLAEFRGRYVLLNLWATWCAPCVRELPALSNLQARLGTNNLLVIPVSIGRDTAAQTQIFLNQHNAKLPVYRDTKSAFLHAFGAFGLPLTVLIDPQGREIARASGALRWDAPESVAYFKSLGKSGTGS